MSAAFHPLVTKWFAETYGEPTAVQAAAWPAILRGEHVLALAPTGSGKTLTAFLAALDRLIRGEYPAEELSVLYVSPLKALNEDIRRNLLEPLGALRARFLAEGLPFPAIRVETRSGDTPQAERRRFLDRPSSILALTPESLAILLLNPRGRLVLSRVKYLIMDEIHTALGTKRGCFLACQVDRLGLIAGEFQRIGLSATVRPVEAAAAFAGGLRFQGPGEAGPSYESRPVRVIAPRTDKRIDFRVEFPRDGGETSGEAQGAEDRGAAPRDTAPRDTAPRDTAPRDTAPRDTAPRDTAPRDTAPRDTAPRDTDPRDTGPYGSRYGALVDYVLGRLGHGTVLIFTGSRRRAERISFLLNEKAGYTAAFTHHGSLSRELRREVERALAAGKLPCVVATSSLELGIDIGAVEEVILAGSPFAAAQTLQRIGRSGHGVGLVSRGRLLPFGGIDLILAAALSVSVAEREIEEIRPIENPLDILAQIILALCAEKERNEEELFGLLRGFYPYRTLPREAYQGVVGMLCGRFEDTRLRELKPRLYRDAETGELSAPAGTLPLLYANGGVIASRGYYSLRLADGKRIGELDEEFVWERRLGDSFDFGARSWRITAIGNEAVEVVPLEQNAGFSPFWRAEAAFRSPLLVQRTLDFFDRWEAYPVSGFPGESFSETAREALGDFIARQKRAQGKIPLPGRTSLPVEIIDDPAGRGDSWVVLLHSFRGAALNQPLALALAEDLETRLGKRVETLPDDNAILLRLPRITGDEPEGLVRESFRRLGDQGWEGPFRRRFESSGTFGALFREAAERSLLLPKAFFGRRTPLWVIRQRSKRLFDAVREERDFPVTAEAWRSSLGDLFDPAGLQTLLEDIRGGNIALGFFRTASPSPFARDLLWKETNTLMYEYDERPDLRPAGGNREGSLTDRVIALALERADARPVIPPRLAEDFAARLRRELPGWAPEDSRSLSEWVKERIAIPLDEWERLTAALPEDLGEELREDPSLGGKIRLITRPGAAIPAVVHREWAELWEEDSLDRLGPWLRYEGPLSPDRIAAFFGVSTEETATALEDLAGELVRDLTLGEQGGLICDRENLDFLLRLVRRKARPPVKERPLRLLTPYLALRQGIAGGPSALPASSRRPPWEKLHGFAAPVRLWETDLFPARDPPYTGENLERAIREGELLWYGAGRERAAFARPEELELCRRESPSPGEGPLLALLQGGCFEIPRDFWALKAALGLDNAACARALWEAVWEGRLSADTWEPVRRGVDLGYVPVETAPQEAGPGALQDLLPGGRGRRVPRALRDRWRAGPPVRGNWFSLALGEEPGEAGEGSLLEEEELNRDRVRLLLARWGILCRPLLEREEGPLTWPPLLPAMRRLEMAGELVTGRFFEGINSLQFASPAVAAELEAAETLGEIYWMNAADPASPSGLNAEGLDPRLPSRLAANRLCFRGGELTALTRRNGGELQIFVPPEDGDLPELLAFVKIPRTRALHPEKKVTLETINGHPAAASPYAGALKALGFLNDRGRLVLW